MVSLEVGDYSKVYWKEISKKCNKATVFIDNIAAECLYWSGGLRLLETANQVREFSSFESVGRTEKKGVFIVWNPAERTSERTLKKIISASSLEYSIVISLCQPNVLSVWRHSTKDFNIDDKSGLVWLEDSVLQWMRNKNFTVEVFYYPVFVCSPCKETFYTPGYASLFPLLNVDISKCIEDWKLRVFTPGQPVPSSDSDHWSIYPQELRNVVRQMVASFHSLFGSLRLKEDIWSVGPLSKCIGDELESWMPARNRRKVAQGSVSLILVDRTLDMAGGVLGFGESVLGRILESHEKLEGHTLDVQVDLSGLLGVPSDHFVPSSLASPGFQESEEESEELKNLFFQGEKEVISSLHESLARSSPRRSDQARKKVSSIQALHQDLKEYEMDFDAVMGNLASVSRAQALVNSSNSQDIVRRKRLQSLCLQFGPHLNQSSEGVLEQLTDLVLSRGDSLLSLTDILLLLVYVYSAAHTNSKFRLEEEERLKSVLGEAILKEGKEGKLEPVLKYLASKEGEMNELAALNIVNHIWSKLEGLLACRSSLSKHSSLLDEDGSYYGFLEQILRDIYHKHRIDVADLHHHAGGLGAMLRSGLGWLGGSASKQHPRQNPWVIVFVVGGITPLEIKLLQGVSEGTDSKLTISGTRILTPKDSLQLLFNNNPLFTDV